MADAELAMPPIGGLMALPGAELAKVVDDTVAMLRVTNPYWIAWYGDSLHAHVQEMLLEGEREARKQVADGEQHGIYGTGGVWINYDAEDGETRVSVQSASAWDTSEDDE